MKKEQAVKKSANTKQKKTSKKHTTSIMIIIAAVVIFGPLFWELNVGNIPFYTQWRECGDRPIVVKEIGPFISNGQPRNVVAYTHLGFFDEKLPLIFK